MPSQLDSEVSHSELDCDGRYISLEGSYNGHKLCFTNVHAPTPDKVDKQNAFEFLDKLEPIINKNSHQLILAGDLNCHLTTCEKYGLYNGR